MPKGRCPTFDGEGFVSVELLFLPSVYTPCHGARYNPKTLEIKIRDKSISESDWIIDIGPGAGEDGGRVVMAGTPKEVAVHTGSRTAPYLARVV